MESYFARQPIFNPALEVVAYEVLFRSGLDNVFRADDANQASSSVLSDSFMNVGLATVSDGKLAFINFTEDLILQGFAELFPKDQIVVELLETIEPTPEVIAACKRLRERGYHLALDDFEYSEKMKPLIDMASIIKVDFTISDSKERAWMAEVFGKKLGIKMLAEKVETHEEFREAKDLGYTYFQGYFFSKPVIITSQRIPESKIASLRLIKEVNNPKVEINALEEIIKTDLSMSYKLMRYINSAFFGLRQEVHSIKQALTLLGLKNIRKWATLISLSQIGDDKPQELVMLSLIRARLCELVAPKTGFSQRDQDLFLLGMFSVLDALVGKPMDEVITDIPIADDLKAALLGEDGKMRHIHDTIIAYESADWDRFELANEGVGINHEEVPKLYLESVDWAQKIVTLET